MVNFRFAKLPDARVTKQEKFIRLGQLTEWDSTDKSGAYSGLILVGEKPHPQGFQTTADFTLNIGEKEISIPKAQESSQLVMSEFQRRGIGVTKK